MVLVRKQLWKLHKYSSSLEQINNYNLFKQCNVVKAIQINEPPVLAKILMDLTSIILSQKSQRQKVKKKHILMMLFIYRKKKKAKLTYTHKNQDSGHYWRGGCDIRSPLQMQIFNPLIQVMFAKVNLICKKIY